MQSKKLTPLGDPHNFGRRVCETIDSQILKPRTTAWEKMFLSNSIVRVTIDHIFKKIKLISPFLAYPTLEFSSTSDGTLIEKLIFNECSDLTANEFDLIGRSVALSMWFGLGDLHFENFIIGRSNSEKFIAAPIDIESIFDDLILPSQMLMLPSKDVPEKFCGLKPIINNYLSNHDVSILLNGYFETLLVLNFNRHKITKAIKEFISSTSDSLIRVIPRATQIYHNVINKTEGFIPLLHVFESEQILRNDIPYYFRKVDSEEIQYWTSKDLTMSNIASSFYKLFDLPKPRLLTRNSKDYGPTDISKCLEAGSLQIMKHLIHEQDNFKTNYKAICLIKDDKKNIAINWNNQFMFKTKIGDIHAV